MWWKRVLLIPHVARLAVRAPRDVGSRWDRYWGSVRATGDGGDVLWDSSTSDEPARYVELLTAHADPGLPVVDVGCGNGRFTRALATRFPRAVGVDLSAHAVAMARQETAAAANLDFRATDMLAPGAGQRLAAELGACHVFVRGVLHVLDAPDRRRLAANLADLLGDRGTLLAAETSYDGPLLGYLESLGAGPAGLPGPLGRAISGGLPRPSRFGAAELEDCFPAARWERVLVDDRARITTVPLRSPDAPDSIPAYVAVLRRRAD